MNPRFVILLFGVLLMFTSPASGQMVDSKSIVGTWVGILDVDSDKNPAEVNFNSGGGFKGSVRSEKSGLVTYDGKWRIEGPNVLVDYIATAATQATANVPAQWRSTWTLTTLQNNTLSGWGVRQSDNLKYDVKLNKK